LPAFKNTPHFASLASVDSTLFTILNLGIPNSPASPKGFNKSVVSPDCETQSKPAPVYEKSSLLISEAILTSIVLKHPISFIRY